MKNLIISLLISSCTSIAIANAGTSSGGAGVAALINEDQMMRLERNLSELDFIKIESLEKPVRSIQDFQTSNGKRGIVVETTEGIPLILMEKDRKLPAGILNQ